VLICVNAMINPGRRIKLDGDKELAHRRRRRNKVEPCLVVRDTIEICCIWRGLGPGSLVCVHFSPCIIP